jgi:molybdopterin-binding protein
MAKIDDYLLNRSSSFPLGSTEEDRTDLTLTQSAIATGRIRGRVRNSVNGAFIDNAIVKVRTQSGDPVSHTITNPSGNYSIDVIVPGTYIINVSLGGFLTTAGQAFTILIGQQLDVDIAITPDSRSRNTIYGIVTKLVTGETIAGVDVVLLQDPGIIGNSITAKSNADGEFIINEVPDGTRTLIAYKSGFYLSPYILVTISGGIIVNSDIALQSYQFPQATVNGFIKNPSGTPIVNACVGLYLFDIHGVEILQQVTFTDSSGFYIFGRAVAGTYVVKAKSEKVEVVV